MSERNKKVRKKKGNIKYRFVILNDATHQRLFAIRGTKLNAIATIAGIILFLFILIFSITAYTPVRFLIPGYPSYQSQKIALENAKTVDSLEDRVKILSLQFTNISRIISGKQPFPLENLINQGKIEEAESLAYNEKYLADSIMKEQINSVEKYSLSSTSVSKQLEGKLFFPPVKGVITQEYNPATGHPFIDIAIQNNSPVHATLDGTVIAAFWDNNTGYNVYMQHDNDLVSVYKHNTKLLVNVGDKVSAGGTISLAGDAGSISTGPHIHFELWYKGNPISPSLYINF